MAEVSIINYGIGNTGSILNMYRKLGISAVSVTRAGEVLAAQRLILPGIGAFDACMEALASSGLRGAIVDAISAGRPMLGICVGMQMLTHGSEEGSSRGLGLVPAFTRRFPADPHLRIPHMGWNDIRWTNASDPLAAQMGEDARFYFVHSYRVICEAGENAMALCSYGGEFAAAIRNGRVAGVQFHPEKSHRFGLQLLRNFGTS